MTHSPSLPIYTRPCVLSSQKHFSFQPLLLFFIPSLGTWLQALWVLVTVEALSPFCPATRCWVKPCANKNSKK